MDLLNNVFYLFMPLSNYVSLKLIGNYWKICHLIMPPPFSHQGGHKKFEYSNQLSYYL